jgi:hypothetical protein
MTSMPNISSRRGAMLPVVLMVTALMTIGLVAVYTLNLAELRVTDDQRESLDAFALAESGREQFLVNRGTLGFASSPPAAAESARIVLPKGYADVVMRQIRPSLAGAPALYILRSHGVRTSTLHAGSPAAERTVAQYLYWSSANMGVLAGWTSLSGLDKNGNSGSLSGIDLCVPAQPSVAGVAVPTSPGYTGHTGPTSGSPPILNLGTAAAAANSVKIDWAGIVAGTALTPTVTIPGGVWPSFADPNFWPTIKVNGNFTLPGNGRGMLIVTGNLTISGNDSWDGVLLIGGNLTSNGNNSVRGATVTALNVKLGQVVPRSDVGNGTKTFAYNSCNVAKAVNRMAALVPYQNGWMDNWASY